MYLPSPAPTYWVVFVTIWLTSCGLTTSPEEQCLQSDRLKFKDPDSLKVVANLGDRGISSDGKGSFWIRYSATNGYGARTSANMACQLGPNGAWERSGFIEATAVLTLYNEYLSKAIAAMRAGNVEGHTAEDAFARATALAKQRVYESPESLNAP